MISTSLLVCRAALRCIYKYAPRYCENWKSPLDCNRFFLFEILFKKQREGRERKISGSEGERERETKRRMLLVYPPNASNDQGWPGTEAGKQICNPALPHGNPSLQSLPLFLRVCFVGRWSQNPELGTDPRPSNVGGSCPDYRPNWHSDDRILLKLWLSIIHTSYHFVFLFFNQHLVGIV